MPAKPRFGADEAAIVTLRCTEADRVLLVDVAERYLSHEERERASRFHFVADRHSYVAAHALVRVVLGNEMGVGHQDLVFEADEHGKPRLSRPSIGPPVHFNLSHTRGLAACAVTRAGDVGVDVEHLRELDDAIELARRYFSPEEIARLVALFENDRRKSFFEIWTLKESYVKARGLGLSLPLDRFSFEVRECEPVRFACADDLGDYALRWQFGIRPIGAEHVVAHAIARPAGSEVGVRSIDLGSFRDLDAMARGSS